LAVEKLQSPKHMKVATNMVIDYNLNPFDFPYLMELNELSSARYFIMRAFKGIEDSLFMHLHKVEELFEGHPLMLECLISDLLKREMYQQAKGIWLRNSECMQDKRFNPLQEALCFDYIKEKDDSIPTDYFGPADPVN